MPTALLVGTKEAASEEELLYYVCAGSFAAILIVGVIYYYCHRAAHHDKHDKALTEELEAAIDVDDVAVDEAVVVTGNVQLA